MYVLIFSMQYNTSVNADGFIIQEAITTVDSKKKLKQFVLKNL